MGIYVRTNGKKGGRVEIERVSELVEMDLIKETAKKVSRSMRTIVVSSGPLHILRRPRAALL